MKTKAVRLYGESDLRLEEFDMGELQDDEILMELITDSVCMSTYKESIQGAKHQRVNDDISEHPIIVGHECAGIIREVGAKWKDQYKVGAKYTMQPALNIEGSMAAIGYSYQHCGGAATFIKVPAIDDFEEKGKTDQRFKELDKITKEHNGLWSKEAEDYLLANF